VDAEEYSKAMILFKSASGIVEMFKSKLCRQRAEILPQISTLVGERKASLARAKWSEVTDPRMMAYKFYQKERHSKAR
jgi:hypothetical protein